MKFRVTPKKLGLLTLAAIQVQFSVSFACITYMTTLRDGDRIVYKGLDRPLAHGHIMINKRGVAKQALPIFELKLKQVVAGLPTEVHAQINTQFTTATWTSKYSSITFNQAGINFPFGGINEKRLSVEVLSLENDTKYNDPTAKNDESIKPMISEAEFAQYILDTSDSVASAKENGKKLQAQNIVKGLHYFICDASSKCASFEYIDGKLQIKDFFNKEIPMLSNTVTSQQRKQAGIMLKNTAKFKQAIKEIPAPNYFYDKAGAEAKLSEEEQARQYSQNQELVRKGIPEALINAVRSDDDRRPLEALFNLRLGAPEITGVFALIEKVKLWDTRWNVIYNHSTGKILFRRYLNEDSTLNLSATEIDMNKIFSDENLIDCHKSGALPEGFAISEVQTSEVVNEKSAPTSVLMIQTPAIRKLSIDDSLNDVKRVLEGEKAPAEQVATITYLLKANYAAAYQCQ